jgi:TonB family protein
MKALLTALIFLSAVSVKAQDTIRSFFNVKGFPTNPYNATYFGKMKPGGLVYYQLRTVSEESRDKDFVPAVQPKEGRYIFLNKEDLKVTDIVYVNDVAQGISKNYFDNGRLSDSVVYKDGKLDGSCTYFHRNGNISAIERYTADSLISFELYDENGNTDESSESPDRMPEFPGGTQALRQFLAQNMVYPRNAIDLGLEGKCYLKFAVDPNGKISSVEVARGVPDCPECDAEAVRVVKAMPDWIPGKNHNRKVHSYFYLPVHFKLVSGKQLRKEKNRGR